MEAERKKKVCFIAEGAYPYTVGGVSSWIHTMINSNPDIEYILLTIVSDRQTVREFKYSLPENLTQVYEVYLQDVDWSTTGKIRRKKLRLSKKEREALQNLMTGKPVEWGYLFDMMKDGKTGINDLLMGQDFMETASACYEETCSQLKFVDFLWTFRSMMLPLFLVMRTDVPDADIYHCVATGYAGVLGAMGKYYHNGGLIISEHGIYTREREEEIVQAEWVPKSFKQIWTRQFVMMSSLAYRFADTVVSLFPHARELQLRLGCPEEKTIVIPNGIRMENFEGLAQKEEGDETVNIGAVIRVTPIKDVKTLIRAFSFAVRKLPNLKLWIMGDMSESPEYTEECMALVKHYGLEEKAVFTGIINVRDMLGKMDMTILTSISEGQPLTILEGFAAKKPAIATDVGNCKGLIYGDMDDYGKAGVITHIMDVDDIVDAMITLGKDKELRERMGAIGYRRVTDYYKVEYMKASYRKLYDRTYRKER